MPLPLIPIAIALGVSAIGGYAKKKIDEKNEFNKQFEIETIPFLISTSYAMANVDGHIDKQEEAFIDKLILDMIKSIDDKQTKNKTKRTIEIIKNKKKEIKLSDAIDYITVDNEAFIKKDLKEYRSLVEDVAKADTKMLPVEIELLNRLDLILEKGRDAKQEILEKEKKDLFNFLPNYYLEGSSVQKNTITTEFITKENNEFLNINDLLENRCYVKHPMDSRLLFDLQDIDKVPELKIIELKSIAFKLGAKTFKGSIHKKTTKKAQSEKSSNEKMEEYRGKAELNINGKTFEEEYNEILTNHYFEVDGNPPKESKEELINSLLWLKNDPNIKCLIENMKSEKKLKIFDYEMSLNHQKNYNRDFNFSLHLELLGHINADAKAVIENKIEERSDFTLKFNMTF